jgi:tetratricopeptide (TPR) repeat protein
MYAMRGEYGKAIAEFDEALKLNPNLVGAYMLRARALYASVSYVTDVGYNFSNVSTLSTNGQTSSVKMRVLERAIEDFTHALILDPYSSKIYAERGLAYADMQNYGKAIADLAQAIQLDNDAVLYNNRGNVYLEMSKYDLAIADFSQAIVLNPNLSEAYIGRGAAYAYSRDYDRAITDHNQAIKLNPNSSYAYNARGGAYFNLGEYGKAIDDFTQAIQLNPNWTVPYINRGNTYEKKRNYDSAIADYETVLQIEPNNSRAREDIQTARLWAWLIQTQEKKR